MRWTIYVLSGTLAVFALLWLTPMNDVVMATGIVEPGDKIYIDAPLRRVVKEILAYEGASAPA